MLDPSLCRYPDHILWALTDDWNLITVDEYIDASQEHNEDNYYSLWLWKYVGAQHEIHKTLDSDLNIFLSDNPQYKSRIFPEQINP